MATIVDEATMLAESARPRCSRRVRLGPPWEEPAVPNITPLEIRGRPT